MNNETFELGEKVRFSHIVRKQRVYQEDEPMKVTNQENDLFYTPSYKRRKVMTTYSELELERDWENNKPPIPLPFRDVYFKNPNYEEGKNGFWDKRKIVYDTGIITGKRYVADYAIQPGSYEDPTNAVRLAGTTRPIYLVTYNLHNNAVMVWPHHLERITDVEYLGTINGTSDN